MTDLATLNKLRLANGKSELKSWKESKARLAERIEAEKAIADSNKQAERLARVEASAKNKPINIKAKLEAEKAAAVKKVTEDCVARATKRKEKRIATDKINVSKIATELGINPKVARAKLRKANVDRSDEAAIRKALSR